MLERAIHALRSGQQPELDQPFDHTAEIDLHIPALIPEDYLPDIHSRLVLYKRIANAASENQLKDLQVEMIDRFGLLPQATKNLFQLTELKLVAKPLGIKKIEGGPKGGRIVFGHNPNIEPMTVIKLVQTRPKMYKLDGENRLRYSADLPGEQDRIAAVHQLLNQLAEPSPEQGLCNN
jgi:transcription-repair coupling factor (superfamily II helicase)